MDNAMAAVALKAMNSFLGLARIETYMDKSDWPDGPWTDEPDKAEWTDEATGLPCLIVRGPMGALCGYVGVGKDHPLHGAGYSDNVNVPQEEFERPIGNIGSVVTLISAVNADQETGTMPLNCVIKAHWGLNYASECVGRICHAGGEKVWWFGFDCGHCDDVTPSSLKRYPSFHGQVYRDVAYVKAEVELVAGQLHNTEVRKLAEVVE